MKRLLDLHLQEFPDVRFTRFAGRDERFEVGAKSPLNASPKMRVHLRGEVVELPAVKLANSGTAAFPGEAVVDAINKTLVRRKGWLGRLPWLLGARRLKVVRLTGSAMSRAGDFDQETYESVVSQWPLLMKQAKWVISPLTEELSTP